MSVPDPDHLLEQAERLAAPSASGAPRQVDLRRAISAAYYSLFHYVSAALADDFVGATRQPTERYALVYRSVDHRALIGVCTEVRKSKPSQGYAAFIPIDGFGPDVAAFALAIVELQQKRHRADYDPLARFQTSDALLAIAAARCAIVRFETADRGKRQLFLTLILCRPR